MREAVQGNWEEKKTEKEAEQDPEIISTILDRGFKMLVTQSRSHIACPPPLEFSQANTGKRRLSRSASDPGLLPI